MDRVMPLDDVSRIASMAIQILTVPCPTAFRPDALVTAPGMGETWMVSQPIEEWEQHPEIDYLIIAGMLRTEKYFEEFTVERLKLPPYNLKRAGTVVHQPEAKHTKDQMDWIIAQAVDLGISSFIFFSQPYHIVRAYLTLVKSYLSSNAPKIVMVPRPVRVPPTIIVPEAGVKARDLIPGEIARIIAYQRNHGDDGDVATLEELETYLDQTF